MTKSVAIVVLFASALVVGTAYVGALVAGSVPTWAPWMLMVGTSTAMLATMVLGASRGGRRIGRLIGLFAVMLVVLVAGFGAALVMVPESADSRLWLGLPPRAAVILYGVGVLPLFVLPVAYALTFESLTLSDADLERVRQAKGSRGQVR